MQVLGPLHNNATIVMLVVDTSSNLIGMNDRACTSVMAVKADNEYARVVWV